ncbi:MAG: hypothetical protein COA58_15155 [Bacteroidetes bacterium]|nr:MAG: hypothetical protein COA58_15155 [Bacteroidota bacterium]
MSSNILILDDHPIIILSLTHYLSRELPQFNILTSSCHQEAIDILNRDSISLLIMDLKLSNTEVDLDKILTFISTVRSTHSENLKIIVFSMISKAFIINKIMPNIDGFFNKSDDISMLKTAIQSVQNGDLYFSPSVKDVFFNNLIARNNGNTFDLTRRELDVLSNLEKGHSNQEIAEILFISPHTVDNHRTNLLKKTSSRNTAELISFCYKNGVLN